MMSTSPNYTFGQLPTASAATRHRQHGSQPPPLSTTLPAVQRFASHLTATTPASATSLSSPFAAYTPGGFTASPAAVRASNVPYNPQQWGPAMNESPGSNSSPGYAPAAALIDPAASAPPPPYSPRRPQAIQNPSPQDGSSPSSQTVSPASNPSPYTTPVSAATTISSVSSTNYQTSTSPLSQTHVAEVTGLNRAQHFPPPPPATSSEHRARSSSRSRTDRPQAIFSLAALTSRSRSSNPASVVIPPQDGVPEVWNAGRSNTVAGVPSGQFSYGIQRPDPENRPPAARRAASTGAIGNANIATRTRSDSQATSRPSWAPGMPLPPPPPGPPPNARSQSLNRAAESSRESSGQPTAPPTRRPPAAGSRLPPVPPTPADWVEENSDAGHDRSSSVVRGSLQIDTTRVDRNSDADDRTAIPSSTSRDIHHDSTDRSSFHTNRGIRERRSESRTGKGRMADASPIVGPVHRPWDVSPGDGSAVKPADLVLPVSASSLTRRPAVSKSTPRSARSMHSDAAPGSAASVLSNGTGQSASTATFTPRLHSAREIHSPSPINPTPPFSPQFRKQEPSPVIPPKSLPTPPPQSHATLDNRYSGSGRASSRRRHSGNNEASNPSSAASPIPLSATSAADSLTPEAFAQAANARHQAFIEREASASTDVERVQIFADFIVSESRVRRQKYASAVDTMGSEILELTRDLFKPYERRNVVSPSPKDSEWSSHRGSLNSAMQDTTPQAESPAQPARSDLKPESAWWGGYMPSLSPIPSMSVSEAPDAMSSRGRPSSRWWEASQEGSITGGGTRGLERSKRESKYMGLPLRDWNDSPSSVSTAAGPSTQTVEYPPEKVGWHEQTTPQSTSGSMLDVSRLVTLPPPFPRHYPAVNNNHPDLTPTRTLVRSIVNLAEVTETQDRFALGSEERIKDASISRRQVSDDIRRQVEAGSISYAEAARLEEAQEKHKRSALKEDFERYEAEVTKPLKSMLNERVSTATVAFENLQSHLLEQNPMEEGDEKPELLEKLTLLKWLFEAREQLFREIFALDSARNERYKAMVIAPYDNEDKIREVEAFFARDKLQRQAVFEKETMQRFEKLLDLVEETVKKGVEVQLSAFWDIAPSLVEVIQTVRVERGVQTDGDYAFSQQYLWEVLCHAEQSTYQFIEGQVNLLCLLHEVKSAVTKQGFKVMAMDGRIAAESEPGDANVDQMDDVLRDEDDRLTADLKEKVKMVEKQWAEAMGNAVDLVKQEVRSWLEENGGWEGMEDI
ncbi:MAG: hypothetical protein M1825_000126 [Sarcosagium campestre]|nr:MAG: hypothetical protein M1825_000126 [Sarcosagium campestre]